MNRKGFTLIEVLVAMVVLAIGLLAVVQMNLIFVKANVYNNQLSAATLYAQEKMEELRGYARSDRTDKFSPIDFDFLIDTTTNFTSVWDVDTANFGVPDVGEIKVIDGLASDTGINELDNGTVYHTMSGSDPFTGQDVLQVQGAADIFKLTRTWTVQPLNVYADTDLNPQRPDYAHVTVTVLWRDQYGEDRNVSLETLIHRRQ